GQFFAFGVGLAADAGITSVTVTPPGGGSPFPLVYDASEDFWFVVFEGYTSLTDLRNDYPLGGYLFEFNGGAMSKMLIYMQNQPACYADITFPTASCVVSPTPTLTWELPLGCSPGAVDALLEDLSVDDSVFDLSFIPGSSGSITLPNGPVTPPPFQPLPPGVPLTIGTPYEFGVDVVGSQFSIEFIGGDSFEYFAAFRNDVDIAFTVGGDSAVIELTVKRDELEWACSGADTIGYDVVRGDLATLIGGSGDYANATLGCVIDDHPDLFMVNNDSPTAGTGYWYLVREATSTGHGSYSGGGSGEQPGRDSGIAASGMDCP
ncbi:MAG: hypothetical protein OEV00_10630, partial [Acidobacteriota bacterium]|nr:hypothetical protein [Acidobacteriota bacterium]